MREVCHDSSAPWQCGVPSQLEPVVSCVDRIDLCKLFDVNFSHSAILEVFDQRFSRKVKQFGS